MTNAELLKQLEQLPPMPIPCHSKNMSASLVKNAKLHKEVVRVTRSTGLSIQWADDKWVRRHLATEPEWLAVELEPFVHNWKQPNGVEYVWQQDDWDVRNGAPLWQYLMWFYKRCLWLRGLIRESPLPADQKIIFIFEHERSNAHHGWPKDEPKVDKLLNWFVHWARWVFPDAEFAWYNWGQAANWSPSPVSKKVYSDYFCTSLYYPADSITNYARLTNTDAARLPEPFSDEARRKLMPWPSLYHYEDRSYTPPGVSKRSPDVIEPNHPGAVWAWGRELVVKADSVCFWPPLFRENKPLMPELFVWFCRGMADVRVEGMGG